MKKVISVISCVALISCLCLTGCGQQNKVAGSDSESTNSQSKTIDPALCDVKNLTEAYELQGVSFSINPDWQVREAAASGARITLEDEKVFFVLTSCLYGQTKSLDSAWESIGSSNEPVETNSWSENGIDYKEGTVDMGPGQALLLIGTEASSEKGFRLYIYVKDELLSTDEMDTLFDGVVSTLNYDPKKTTVDYDEAFSGNSASSTSSSESSSPNNTQPTKPTATVSQQNALSKAKSYLNVSAFSYTGLIEQLEYEQFSTEDATYGADNCGADWNEQAAKKAASYMSINSFSRGGLIDQLVFEGFTEEQAAYGADSVGL